MERAAPGSPIWPCTRWGFPCLLACAWSGGLLPRLFTLTPPFRKPDVRGSNKIPVLGRAWRFIFCGTVRQQASRLGFPRVSPGLPSCVGTRELRGIAPSGVRTFLPSGKPKKRSSAFPKSIST